MSQPPWQLLALEGIRWRRGKQLERAIQCFIQSIELTRHTPELVGETATHLNYLADLYLQAGLLAQAEATIREAISHRQRLPSDVHHLIADDLLVLGRVLSQQGSHQEAVDAGTQALALVECLYGPNDPVVEQSRALVANWKGKLSLVALEAQP